MADKTTTIKIPKDAQWSVVRKCIVCGDSTESIHGHLCSKCKQAILKMREEMEDTNDR